MSDQDATTTEAAEATTETADESTVGETASEEVEGQESLGDKGKQALDRMKNKWQSEQQRRKALEAEIAALKTAKPAEDSDTPDLDAIRAEAAREALTKANERVLRSEVKAAATGKLADPADAYKFLDLTQFEVNDDGSVDADEIADAIDELVKSKPYLAAQGGPRFKGTADGGTRKETRPSQLSRADLAGMSPEAIEEARVAGRLDDLLSGKHS